MAGREIRVRNADEHCPVGDRRGTVLMLPGRAYSCGMSLLAWTTRALQATGWTVFQAEWDLPEVPAEPREFIYPAVWLTPVLNAAGVYPLPAHSDALAERIREYPTDNLVVGGTADSLRRTGFRGTGKVLEIEGANHGLEVADWRTSIRHHEGVASAVADFACGLAR